MTEINEYDNFFSKTRIIEENRNRLKELYEQYKKTENYYPLFLAYITAFGFYFFDFIVALFKFSCPWYLYAITIFTGITFIYVLYLIWMFFKSVDWSYDYLPYGIYKEFPEEILSEKPELSNDENLLRKELFLRYIKDLEDFVKKDLDLYTEKRNKLKKIWVPMIISLCLYTANISVYKYLSDRFEKKEPLNIIIMSPTKIVINENKKNNADSGKASRGKASQSEKKTFNASRKINSTKNTNNKK